MSHTVGEFMTRSPHSVGLHMTLADAHALMREFRIRHLPVLEGGKLVGMVSERDLHLIETLRDVKPREVEVDDAMSPEPFVVSEDAPLEDVALEMWKHKYGSAVVMSGRKIAGVFTTTDALRALATLLKRERRTTPRPAAKKVPRTRGAR